MNPHQLRKLILEGVEDKFKGNLTIKTNRDRQGNAVGNHAKFLMVDGKTAIMGSHNLYDNSLAEASLLTVDKEIAQQYDDKYWKEKWRNGEEKCENGEEKCENGEEIE